MKTRVASLDAGQASEPVDLVAERGRRLLAALPIRSQRMAPERRSAARENWRAFGRLIVDLRALYPCSRDFHAAIVRNGWDAAPANYSGVRKDAAWLATNPEALIASHAGRAVHPSAIRTWWTRGRTADEERIRMAVKIASDLEFARLRGLFEAEVQARVQALIAPAREKLNRTQDAVEAVLVRNRALGETINGLMTEDEFDLIRGLLHPDRHPGDRQERFARAFQIFSALRINIDRKIPIETLRAQGWTIYGKERANRRA